MTATSKRFTGLAAGLAAGVLAIGSFASAQVVEVYSDDFEGYVDNAALTAAYTENTLELYIGPDTFTRDDQSVRNPGTAAAGDRLLLSGALSLDATVDPINATFWLYDSADSGASNAALSFARATFDMMTVGLYDVQSTDNYSARIMSGGPGWVTLPVARSIGWHKFEIAMQPSGDIDILHNDAVVHSATYTPNAAHAWGSWIRFGPAAGAPGTDSYYDDFVVTTGAPPVPLSTVEVGPSGDYATIQDAISSFTPGGDNDAATPPFTINIDPAGGPYNERITLNDARAGLGDIVGDITLQSSVPGTHAVLALQRSAGEPSGTSTSCLQIYQNEHNVTLRDLLIHPALPGVGVEDATRYIVKIDENSANAVFNTVTLENCIITEVAADGLPLITSAAEAFDPPRADSASGRTSTFSNTVQTWGDAGESVHVVLDGCVLYGPPPPGIGGSANHLRAVFAGQDGESLTITDTIMSYGPNGHGIRFGSGGAFAGTLTIDGLTVYNSPAVGANHLVIFEGTPAGGPTVGTITNSVFVRDVELDTATRGISGGGAVDLTDLSNSIIVTSGAGIVDIVASASTWSNITVHNNSTAGNNATFLVGGAGSLDITDAIFSGPGTKLAGTEPTGGMSVDFSSFVEEGADAINARDDGTIVVSYGTDIINADPLYLSKTFGDADYFHVDSQCYEGAGTGGTDLAGGATYVGGTTCTVSVDQWMILHD